MNPELTQQISERLSRLHEDPPVTMARPDTEVRMAASPDGNTVTLNAGDFPLLEMTSQHQGFLRSELIAAVGLHGPKTGFGLSTSNGVVVSDGSETLPHPLAMDLHLTNHVVLPDQHVTVASVHAATATSMVEPSPDEVDEEFWKALGMKGPEDMTPDKLVEITKKLRDFQRGLKRMQRESPVTMGIAVRVKHRTSKKRKKKK